MAACSSNPSGADRPDLDLPQGDLTYDDWADEVDEACGSATSEQQVLDELERIGLPTSRQEEAGDWANLVAHAMDLTERAERANQFGDPGYMEDVMEDASEVRAEGFEMATSMGLGVCAEVLSVSDADIDGAFVESWIPRLMENLGATRAEAQCIAEDSVAEFGVARLAVNGSGLTGDLTSSELRRFGEIVEACGVVP
jgi:hypothetical protein